MINQGVESPVRVRVIPRRQLLVIVVGMIALIGTAAYFSFSALAQVSDSNALSSSISSRLASEPDQVNTEGEVTLRVTWRGPEAGPVFDVAMDTHSVNLDPYDLSQMVVLHTNDGRESAVLKWDAAEGGHHRNGNLVFSDLALDGKPFVTADTRSIELVIYDLSGVSTRSFTWDLK
ncbi:MAG: hypothetical protein ABI670_11645 [Chloroflexota bacterium]